VLLLFTACIKTSYGQEETYFYKIQDIIHNEHLDTALHKKLDSIKQTRRPNDSGIKTVFNRDVDFGYRHKRIQVKFNSDYYQVNLLLKNDTICFGSVIMSVGLGDEDEYNRWFNKKHSIPIIDSPRALTYLKSRNLFYNASKTLKDLKNELGINEFYALRGGDGYNYTWNKLHLDTLVKQKNFRELESMLSSISCEEQMYGLTGFDWLKNERVKIPANDIKIIQYIKKRNSDLETCQGDVCGFISKGFK
jgi:hypothetical protein